MSGWHLLRRDRSQAVPRPPAGKESQRLNFACGMQEAAHHLPFGDAHHLLQLEILFRPDRPEGADCDTATWEDFFIPGGSSYNIFIIGSFVASGAGKRRHPV